MLYATSKLLTIEVLYNYGAERFVENNRKNARSRYCEMRKKSNGVNG